MRTDKTEAMADFAFKRYMVSLYQNYLMQQVIRLIGQCL
jgi:hypothetical protein